MLNAFKCRTTSEKLVFLAFRVYANLCWLHGDNFCFQAHVVLSYYFEGIQYVELHNQFVLLTVLASITLFDS